MKRFSLAFLLLTATTVHADPPTTCPRILLIAKDNGYNFGRFWQCKSVNIESEPPHYVTCIINSQASYDVGEFDSQQNKWWIYSPNAELYDTISTSPDSTCSEMKRK